MGRKRDGLLTGFVVFEMEMDEKKKKKDGKFLKLFDDKTKDGTKRKLW